MAIYWVLLTVITLNTFLSYWIKNKGLMRLTTFSSFLLIFIFAAVRKGIGVDYINYYYYYREFCSIGHFHKSFELGYTLINKLCCDTGWGFTGLIIITSFLSYFPVFLVSLKSEKPLIQYAFFLLYYPMSYALIRQCIGSAFAVLFTYEYLSQYFPQSRFRLRWLLEKKRVSKYFGMNMKCLLYAACACLFHNSLIVYFMVLVVSSVIYIDTIKAIPMILATLVICLKATPILNIFINMFSDGEYERYFTGGGGAAVMQTRQSNSGLGILLRYFVYVVSFILISNLLAKRSKQEKTAFHLMFTAMVGCDAISLQSQIFLRFKFLFFIVYILPLFFMEQKGKKRDLDFIIQLGGFSFLLLYEFAFRYRNELYAWRDLPYTSLFS